eukprot:TRINITY_DN40918_c0_g1_i1.p1 TRINITY_DN40918_c0_g1~~TRINITY_DN40918_c0_g1_i1.p1  ORF type:complete len:226 (+),score=44.86 TRINITY_DN40918_c0_g1_i1:69-746(+)
MRRLPRVVCTASSWRTAQWQLRNAAMAAAWKTRVSSGLVVPQQSARSPGRRRPKPASALPKGAGIEFASAPVEVEAAAPEPVAVSDVSIAGGSLTALQRRQRKSTKQVIELTEAAAHRIRELLSRRSDGPAGVSIGVKKRGCNGLSYTMDYYYPEQDGKRKPGSAFEAVTEQHGVKVHVGSEAFMFVVGTVMNFERDKTEEKFVFLNPNSEGSCGCGESFVPAKQ